MANPYRPGAPIRVAESPAAWWIRDVAGRVVASGTAGGGSGGASFAWDGRDRVGSPVASGVYLMEVLAAGGRETRRFALLRR
jgi:hypothetical protein